MPPTAESSPIQAPLAASDPAPIGGAFIPWQERLAQRITDRPWLPALGLVLLALITYQKVWSAGFIWDDNAHVTKNPCIVGPLGLWDIWTSAAARICPLVLTTFWGEYHLFGADPLPFHLVNVLVHSLGAIALWRVLRALQAPGAWLAAALWELHPVQVETVAWITELKNTQSCLFYLLSILYFIKSLQAEESVKLDERRSILPTAYGLYLAALAFAALAMASKSSTVVLPFVWALCAWWVGRGWRWRMAYRLIPVFLLALATGLLSLWTQNLEGANDVEWVRTPLERLITAGGVFWFYLGKLAWPHPLIFVYPRWAWSPGLWTSYLPTAAAIFVFGLLFLGRRRWRGVYLTYTYFGVALLPVLGILDHFFLRYSFVGDHFQYLASIGPLAFVGTSLACGCRLLRIPRAWQALGAVALVLPLATQSWRRVAVYQSNTTLWRDTLSQNPTSYLAYHNLAGEELAQGQATQAIAHWKKSLELWPHNADAYSDLGAAYLCLPGKTDEAIKACREALAISPQLGKAHVNLGTALYGQGHVKAALEHFREALRIAPRDVVALKNAAWVLATSGDPTVRNGAEALALAERAHAIEGDTPSLLRKLAAARAATGDLAGASDLAQLALRLNAGKDTHLARQLRQDMSNYHAGQPITERFSTGAE